MSSTGLGIGFFSLFPLGGWYTANRPNIVRPYKVRNQVQAMPEPLQKKTLARRHKPGTAAYENGRATAQSIIETAQEIVLRDGLTGLTMRRLAAEAGLSPGNLSYYYATKQDLYDDLFGYVLERYLLAFEQLRTETLGSAEAQLRAVLEFVYDDLSNRETTNFFPELWAAALREPWAARHFERIYSTHRGVLENILSELRPELPRATLKDIAVILQASIEGQTLFVGHERTYRRRRKAIKELLIDQLVTLAQTAGTAR